MTTSFSALLWSARHVRSVLWPLVLSTVCRIVDQVLAIAILATAAAGAARAVVGGVDVPRLVITLAVLTLIKAVVRYVEQYSGHYVAFKALEELRVFAFSRVWPGAPANTASAKTGDLLTRMTKDIDRIEVFFAHTIAPVISAVVVPIIALTWMGMTTSPVLAWIAAAGVFAVAAVIPTVGWFALQRASQSGAGRRGEFAQFATESVQGVREIVGYGYNKPWLERSTQLTSDMTHDARREGALTAARRALTQFVTLTTVLLVLGDGGARLVRGTLSLEQLALATAVTLACFSAVKAIDSLLADLDRAGSAAHRLRMVVSEPPAVSDPEQPAVIPAGPVAVEFSGVTFTYPGARTEAVAQASLVIPAGARAVIVGRSGSGKTTLAHLLLRYWDTDAGVISVGGVPVNAVAQDELRSRVAVVSQRTHLFAMSIAENLRIARPEASSTELQAACEVAQLHDDIVGFPDGYDTVVGEFGESLSGGQRQRLALARALLSDADVFVLDEYTSSLDEDTAGRVRRALRAASAHATIVEITHRPQDAVGADCVFRVDHGSVTQVTAGEVLATIPE